MTVLVLGANGQLGSCISRALAAEGLPVRGLVRTRDRGAHLAGAGVDVVIGDLSSPAGLAARHLDGVSTLVITANAAAPRAGDDPRAFQTGLLRAVEAASATGVDRVLVASLPDTPVDGHVPFVRARRDLERRLRGSGMETVVLRMPPFMEFWLALVGSSVPLRGEPQATIGRPSPFLRRFRAGTSTLVERRGLMLVSGPPSLRNAYISVRDVARAFVAAVRADSLPGLPYAEINLAGPEVLSWRDVAGIYQRQLRRRVRIVSTPAAVFTGLAALLAPFAPVASNTMALNRLAAVSETDWSPGGGGLIDPASMLTVEQFLAGKLALPEAHPSVV